MRRIVVAILSLLVVIPGYLRGEGLTDDGLGGLTNINKILSLISSGPDTCRNRFFEEVAKNLIQLDEMEDFKMSVDGRQFVASFRIGNHNIEVKGNIGYLNPPGEIRIDVEEAKKKGFFRVDVKKRLFDALGELEHSRVKIEGDGIILDLGSGVPPNLSN